MPLTGTPEIIGVEPQKSRLLNLGGIRRGGSKQCLLWISAHPCNSARGPEDRPKAQSGNHPFPDCLELVGPDLRQQIFATTRQRDAGRYGRVRAVRWTPRRPCRISPKPPLPAYQATDSPVLMTPLAFAFPASQCWECRARPANAHGVSFPQTGVGNSTRDCRPLQPRVSDPASRHEALQHSAIFSTPLRPLGGVLAK